MENPEIPGNYIEAMYEGLDLQRITKLESEAVGDEFAKLISKIKNQPRGTIYANIIDID